MLKQVNNIVLLSAAAVVVLLIIAAIYFLKVSQISVVVGLPMLSIGAVIVLVILLCSMSVVFASYDLQDKAQALAMPEGSIRAVIALMLIVLFAILSIYLFGSLASGQMISMGEVPEDVRAALVAKFGEGNVISVASKDGLKSTIWIRESSTPEGVDFAKQLLVLVGTLVTSISSFYFGSKTAILANERATTKTDRPAVETMSPTALVRGGGAQDFSIQGSGLDRITGAKFTLNGKQIAATGVKATATGVQFKLDVPAAQDTGIWSLTLIDSKLGDQATTMSLTIS